MSTPLANEGDMTQLIDGDGTWNPNLDEQLKAWGFTNSGFNYWTVSILGCQSSGKSTLLNLLFETKFPVMEASLGRTQTTQGIWMGKSESKDSHSILVLDVEGTDGRERGEEQKAFERKSSLFSLALTEVLIINMWVHDIGRYNAANYGLLKTVFELNLQLFQKSTTSKTLLLFVIRDHVKQVTPLDRLKTTIDNDLNTIWKDLSKPEQHKNSNVRDFFDVSFTSLSNKMLQEEDFIKDVGVLRTRFIDPSTSDYIFQHAYQKDVPADGWSVYGQRIWATIQDSRDLDLPTQKEMLAMFRCEEIMMAAHKKFAEDVQPLKIALENKKSPMIEKFGSTTKLLLDNALAEYDEPASRYHAEVASKKKEQLKEKITDELYSLFIVQISKIKEGTLLFLEGLVKEITPKDKKETIKNFAEEMKKCESRVAEFFEKNARDSELEGANWEYGNEVEEVKDLIKAKLVKLEADQLNRLLGATEEKFKFGLMGQLNKFLDAAEPEMWTKIATLFDSLADKAVEEYLNSLQDYHVSDEIESEKVEELRKRTFGVLKERMREKAEHTLYTMEKKFNDHFRLDDRGLPRRWRQGDDVATRFTAARQLGYTVLDLYSIIRLTPEHKKLSYLSDDSPVVEDPSIIVLTLDQTQILQDRFKKESEAAYVQAVREQESSSMATKIPAPMILLLIILGFNEFWALLTNPLLLVLAIFASIAAYIIWFLGFADVPLQIVSEVTSTLMANAKGYVVSSVVQQVVAPRTPTETKKKND